MTVSVGIALLEGEDAVGALIKRADQALAKLASDAIRRQFSRAEVISIDKIVMLSPNQAQVLFTMKVAPSGRLPRGSGPKNNEFQAVAQLLVQPRETLVCSYLPRPADSL